jgi:hypothetical protein
MKSLRWFLCFALAATLPQLVLAQIVMYTATLNGANDNNGSPGMGTATVIHDIGAHTMEVEVTFSGLTANVTASHIHAATTAPFTGTAGVATTTPTFTGFPTGVTSGTYDHTFDMTSAASYNASYITANGGTTTSAEMALFSAMDVGESYLNIHTTAFPGGEISGFLSVVPEPTTYALVAGLIGLAGVVWHRRRMHPAATAT